MITTNIDKPDVRIGVCFITVVRRISNYFRTRNNKKKRTYKVKNTKKKK